MIYVSNNQYLEPIFKANYTIINLFIYKCIHYQNNNSYYFLTKLLILLIIILTIINIIINIIFYSNKKV